MGGEGLLWKGNTHVTAEPQEPFLHIWGHFDRGEPHLIAE